ncbi:MAG: hypothetical protein AAGG02_08605 [Cyanobacteria bacterium P01_H01_bin.15]
MSIFRWGSLGLLLTGGVFIAATVGFPIASAQVQVSGLTLRDLQQGTYLVPQYGLVELTNGVYQGEDFRVTLEKHAVFGDLNGNGLEDAIAVLQVQSKGIQNERYLVAALATSGGLKHVDSVSLKVPNDFGVKSLTLSDEGIVDLLMVKPNPNLIQNQTPFTSVDESLTEKYRFSSESNTLLAVSLDQNDTNASDGPKFKLDLSGQDDLELSPADVDDQRAVEVELPL